MTKSQRIERRKKKQLIFNTYYKYLNAGYIIQIEEDTGHFVYMVKVKHHKLGYGLFNSGYSVITYYDKDGIKDELKCYINDGMPPISVLNLKGFDTVAFQHGVKFDDKIEKLDINVNEVINLL